MLSPTIHLIRPNLLEFSGKTYPCAIGRAGLVAAEQKREGDGKTPMGNFRLRGCYYRPDRITPPRTLLPLIALSPDDGWCDDPAHAAYNRPVKLPFAACHERLWRDDHAYDLILPLGYNDDPVVAGRGSAIFLHAMHDDGRPTAGCIAMRREDLLTLLPEWRAGTTMVIG